MVLAALLCLFMGAADVSAGTVTYTVLYLLENADDDHYTVMTEDSQTGSAEAGTPLTELTPPTQELASKYPGFHLLGSGAEIKGYEPGDDYSRGAGISSEKGAPVFAYGYTNGAGDITAERFAYLAAGEPVVGTYTEGSLTERSVPSLREDGNSLILVFYNRDRFAVSLRARNPEDPLHPAVETGDESWPLLPEDPILVKYGADFSKRFSNDSAAAALFRHFSDSAGWTWWARWKGVDANGDPLAETDLGKVYTAAQSCANEFMDGPAFGLEDGDPVVLELREKDGNSKSANIVYSYKKNTGIDVLHKTVSGSSGSGGDTGFTLKIQKNVSGSLSSKDKYFKFTISITNAGAGTVLTMSSADQDPYYIFVTNPAYTADVMKAANTRDDDRSLPGQQIKCNSSGSAEITVYLRHRQDVELSDLPKGTRYSVAEEAETDYEVSDLIVQGSGNADETERKADGSIDQNTTVSFTNNYGTTPTGIYDSVKPALWLLALAAALGIAVFVFRKRRQQP